MHIFENKRFDKHFPFIVVGIFDAELVAVVLNKPESFNTLLISNICSSTYVIVGAHVVPGQEHVSLVVTKNVKQYCAD